VPPSRCHPAGWHARCFIEHGFEARFSGLGERWVACPPRDEDTEIGWDRSQWHEVSATVPNHTRLAERHANATGGIKVASRGIEVS